MSVFVGPSIWRAIDIRTSVAMTAAMLNAPHGEPVIYAPTWNDALIGRSRSLMCTAFLETDADVMVIIDDDIVFESPDFWKIVEGARATRSIYGGVYVTRSTEPHISSRFFPDGQEIVIDQGPVRRPHEIQYLATGFFAIHRDVLEKMIDAEFEDAYGGHKMQEVELGANRPFWPFFSPFVCREEDGRLHYLSEDWAFCNRARQLGFQIWADLSIVLQHMGLYPYTVRDLDQEAMKGLPSKGTDTLTTSPIDDRFGCPILDNVIEDLAEFTGDDEGDVRRLMDTATESLAKAWLSRKERDEDWYRREDVGYYFLADLAKWHKKGAGILPDEFNESLNGKRVLDFGAGNGQMSLRAAIAGADVDAMEPNFVMRQFIRHRSVKYVWEQGGGELRDHSEIPDGTFDVIFAWHVFEHLQNPEQVLDDLLSRLRPGGMMVTQSGFSDPSTPMHYVMPVEEWEAILESRGLKGSDVHVDTEGKPWAYSYVREAVPA